MSSNDPKHETIQEMVDRVLHQKQQWSKHLAHTCCRCEKCTCGKHLCKFEPTKVNLKSGNTTYHDQYTKKQARINNRKLEIPIQTYHPRQFVKKSQYQDQYYRKKTKRQKIERAEKKQDNLQLGGPTFAATTYQNSYQPKYLAPPQKIKNPENIANPHSRMNATSSYRDNYNWSNRKPTRQQQPIRYTDNLKPHRSDVFIGQSSYDHDYHRQKNWKQKGDTFAPHEQYHPVRGLRPQSSYRCDYTGKQGQPCPALKCPVQDCC